MGTSGTRRRWTAAVILPALALSLSACAPGSHTARAISDEGTTTSAAKAGTTTKGTLVVLVTLTGGPMRPSGHMALDKTPANDMRVVVHGANGRTWAARTQRDGTARFRLPAGDYGVSSPCGESDDLFVVGAGATVHVTNPCYVP